ncbi:MAG: pentapeptide repeat-containing protein [Chloroflexi bacterium]|nr:pentapeptide repeat-containing protein [Chloroflexota bacterium]
MDQWILVLMALPFLLFVVLMAALRLKEKTGWPSWTGFQSKTLWDFMSLLVVPVMLGSMALIYGSYDASRQFAIENQREEAQLVIEDNRINEDILQSYFDDISNLMLNYELSAENLAGTEVHEFTDAQIIARARTLATVSVLDGKRNGLLLRFLLETNLFDLLHNERLSINLEDAILSEYDLSGASLNTSNLSQAVLVRTDFSEAYLLDINFQGANLHQANLQGAALFRADFSEAILTEANLEGAFYDINTIWPEGFDPVAAGAIETTIEEWAKSLNN